MSIDSALSTFLDLMALVEEPGFVWGPPELRAAFQWAHTLQQLVDNSAAAATVQQRIQSLQDRVPAGLLRVMSHRPLQLALERLLARPPPPASPPGQWLEAVLAAYMAVAVLGGPHEQQAAAEQQLLATLAQLQQAAAMQGVLSNAAQQAAAAAAARVQLQQRSASGGSQELSEQALRSFTSPACLQAAAAAQLLAEHVERVAARQPELPLQALQGLLHSPATQLELELLCWLALLPQWEAVLQRLAGGGGRGSSLGGSSSMKGGCGFASAALLLLCEACSSQPEALLHVLPELLAEVCRQSFRFTCAYAALLAEQRRQAASETKAAAAAMQRRLDHATKHPDHVSDYFRSKCSVCC